MGVTNAESPSAQGTEEQAAGLAAGAGTEAPEGEHEESIPYERFKQANERAKAAEAQLEQLKPWGGVINRIKAEAGFQSPQQVLAYAEQQETARAVQTIQQKLQAKVTAGEMTVAAAEEVYRTEVERFQLSQRLSSTEQRSAVSELTAARKDYPEMDEEYVAEMFRAGRGSITDLAKKSHDKNVARLSARGVDYQKVKEEQETRPVPLRAGGGPAGARSIPNPFSNPKEWKEFEAGIQRSLMKNGKA